MSPSSVTASSQSAPQLGAFIPLPFATNSHIHLPPNFSAFESTAEPVQMAVDEGLGLLGVSNYYDFRVYETFGAMARERGIFPLLGTEIIALDSGLHSQGVKINDPGNPGKMYICGKAMRGVSNLPVRGRGLLNRLRLADERRMVAMCDRLRTVLREKGFAVDLTAEQIRSAVAQSAGVAEEAVVLQERHLAMAFQRAIWCRLHSDSERLDAARLLLGDAVPTNPDDEVAIQNGIRSAFLKAGKAAFVAEEFVSVREAQELVLSASGIPCYPVLADGANPITGFEADPHALAASFKRLGFHAVEFIPNRNKPDVLSEYVHGLRKAGLIVLAGTEHNTTEKIALTPVCAGGLPIPPEVRAIFDEGICVAVAHQATGMRFVDEDGELTWESEDLEVHISRMARAGAEILLETHGRSAKGAKS